MCLTGIKQRLQRIYLLPISGDIKYVTLVLTGLSLSEIVDFIHNIFDFYFILSIDTSMKERCD